jgi:cystathionine beta-lyase/cystathionine gamma-synthase
VSLPGPYSRIPLPVVPPIYQSTTFDLTAESYADITGAGGVGSVWYSRFRNPTTDDAAVRIAALEGGADAVMTASGMSAIVLALLAACQAGDTVLSAREVYGDTHDLLTRDLSRLGIRVVHPEARDSASWAAAIEREQPRVVYAETMSNPQLRLLDIPGIAAAARQAGASLIVDNTFASPYLVRPLELGADVVVDSVTKYLNGHSDVVAGVVVADDAFIARARLLSVTLGSVLDPHAAFLVSRGLKTFGVRLAQQNAAAAELAGRLAALDGVRAVVYPGRPDHPDHALAARIMRGDARGAMVTLVIDTDDTAVVEVMNRLRVIRQATSLGGVESLISAPFNSSHFSLTPEERDRAGIVPGMLRLSVGLEEPDEIFADLARAISAVVPPHVTQEVPA